jgi:hypothetical protein
VVAGKHAAQMRRLGGKHMNREGAENARLRAAAKLHPSEIHTSTFLRSILGYLVHEVWTDPRIYELICHRNGELLARESDSEGFMKVLCTADRWSSQFLVLAHLRGLSPREHRYLLVRIPTP